MVGHNDIIAEFILLLITKAEDTLYLVPQGSATKSIFSPIGKLLGMQDIEIGDPKFDDAFIIKSSSEDNVRRLLANSRLRELIDAQPAIYLSVRDDEGWFGSRFPEGVDELYFQTVGVIKDLQRLEGLYNLFAETLEELCRLRLAGDETPGVELR